MNTMAANNFSFFSKSMLVRIADMFHPREVDEVTEPKSQARVRKMPEGKEQSQVNTEEANSKLNITLKDLKTISTALLHYRRSLNKMGESLRADQVAEIDKKFYQILQQLEGQATASGTKNAGAAVAA